MSEKITGSDVVIRLGGAKRVGGDGARAAEAGARSPRRGGDEFAPVLAALREHGRRLAAIPGVALVRPGYRFVNGRITPEPAIVVVVFGKRPTKEVAKDERIPPTAGGVPVDVLPATPPEQLRYLGQEGRRAAGEDVAAERVTLRLPGEEGRPEVSIAVAPLLEYRPPAGAPLAEVDEQMRVVCHVSPDAGWRLLKGFLEGTGSRLTSTMYEFNARHILDTLLRVVRRPRTFNLIMDAKGADTRDHDFSKEEARAELADELVGRLRFAWAPVRLFQNRTTHAFFESAYHTKVSVRDGAAFWLSSGNWKYSGQPVEDPFAGPLPGGTWKWRMDHNREWNVIVENRSLARLLEKYILHDIKEAEPLQVESLSAAAAAPAPDLFVPEAPEPEVAAASQLRWFREQVFDERVRVKPLLTPDNYVEHVTELVRRARHKLYITNQYIKPDATDPDPRYERLIELLVERSWEDNLDARFIIRGNYPENWEVMQRAGFQMSKVKKQRNTHTKGIVVDDGTDSGDTIAVVGSHNLSGDGATVNRDASLVFYHNGIASYFEDVFTHDWDNLARPDDIALTAMPRVAAPGEPTPPGTRRVTWSDYYGDGD